jgi:RNA polymerase sigma-70 factor (ECF subfamily)
MSITSTLFEQALADGLGLTLLPLLLLGAVGGDESGGDAEGDAAEGGDASGPGDPEPPVVSNPDHELVRAVLDGDATAYRGLVERYQGRIYNVIYGMVRNREDARDLTQDAFVKAYKNLTRFRFGSSFYTWICRIGMNVAIDHLRKQKVRKAQEFDDGIATRGQGGVISLAHHRDDPRRELHRKQLHALILAALDELPDEQRQVVVLREMEGMAYKEIAEVMDIPEGTVMSRLYYARKKLQAALKEIHKP